jgi:catechol 2,3-dioxygenase-like lactoylglutathione lyase family enzyme
MKAPLLRRVAPMIHVPDVRAAVAWYTDLGFRVIETHSDEGELDWAMLGCGDGVLLFNAGGQASSARRREVDLYVDTKGVAALAERLRGRVEMVEDLHETFYGMREFIIRDLNGFWVTFGEKTSRA